MSFVTNSQRVDHSQAISDARLREENSEKARKERLEKARKEHLETARKERAEVGEELMTAQPVVSAASSMLATEENLLVAEPVFSAASSVVAVEEDLLIAQPVFTSTETVFDRAAFDNPDSLQTDSKATPLDHHISKLNKDTMKLIVVLVASLAVATLFGNPLFGLAIFVGFVALVGIAVKISESNKMRDLKETLTNSEKIPQLGNFLMSYKKAVESTDFNDLSAVTMLATRHYEWKQLCPLMPTVD